MTDPFLDTSTRLTPGSAAAALIVVGGRYLMQLRDPKIGIFYPGHWGLFGGAIEPGETEAEALARELGEELGIAVALDDLRYFTTFTFDFTFAGLGPTARTVFELSLPEGAMAAMVLGEGREMRLFAGDEILSPPHRVAPYDAFLLWMHHHRHRFGPI